MDVSCLTTPVSSLKGVGKVIAAKLHDNGLFTVRDLLLLKPTLTKYIPLTNVAKLKSQNLIISHSSSSEWQRKFAIPVTVKSTNLIHGSRSIVNCLDPSGHKVQGVSMDKRARYLVIDSKWILEGSPIQTSGGAVMLVHPVWHKFTENWQPFHNQYPVKKITQAQIDEFIKQAIELVAHLPDSVIRSLIAIHQNTYLHGNNDNAVAPGDVARYRDLLRTITASKYNTCRDSLERIQVQQAHCCTVQNWEKLKLPFELTNDQLTTLDTILQDLSLSKPMSRMVQGDVGSGKTVVALSAAQYVADAGFQSALMAPTNVLAMQHYETAKKLMRCPVFFLNNKTKVSEKRAILSYTEPCLIVGTHAITYLDTIPKLAFVVIDEQHKFGVQQRLKLRKAGVHALSMSATPIPRSLCLTSLGYLQLSIIREKPPGRVPITTYIKSYNAIDDVYNIVHDAINEQQVIYWVCHRVVEDLTEEKATVEGRTKSMEEHFPGKIISMFSGTVNKESVIDIFKSGAKPILVASTVVEVGMDIKNAKVMVIEQSELFGLAQLHQLRGRVGRGDIPGICILLHSDSITPNGKRRLQILEESQDGFEIALRDQEIRGSGDILGTKQSGNKIEKFFDSLAEEIDDADIWTPSEAEKVLWGQTDLGVLESV